MFQQLQLRLCEQRSVEISWTRTIGDRMYISEWIVASYNNRRWYRPRIRIIRRHTRARRASRALLPAQIRSLKSHIPYKQIPSCACITYNLEWIHTDRSIENGRWYFEYVLIDTQSFISLIGVVEWRRYLRGYTKYHQHILPDKSLGIFWF